MAIRPDDATVLAKALLELFSEAETVLLQRIARALAKGTDKSNWAEEKLLGIQALRKQVDAILADLAANVPGTVERAVGLAYNRGIATAGTDLTAAGLPYGAFSEVQVAALAAGLSLAAAPSLGLPQIPPIGFIQPTGGAAAIVSETMARLRPMNFQISRAVTDTYQQVVTQTAAQITLGTVTRREASKVVLDRLAKQGITGFKDSAGRNWSMPSYAEMAMRTAASHAMLQGHVDRLRELGVVLVCVSDAPEECALCRPFEGKVLTLDGSRNGDTLKDGHKVVASLDEAVGKGLFHPNCRHSLSIFIPGITKVPTDTEDPEGNALRVKQRAYERRVRELKRADAIAQEFGGPEAQKARAKLRAKEAEFKAWREEHGRKNLAYRTSLNFR